MSKKKTDNFAVKSEQMEQNSEIRKYKILVIDKDKEQAEHTIARFKNVDYQFISYYKSKDILSGIKKEKADLILMEVDLNELDGIELCYEIKNDVLYKKVPVVFLAERSDDYTQLAAYDAGCDAFIGKPSKSRLLAAKVKAVLHRCYEMEDKAISVKKYGSLEIDEEQVLVYKKGSPLKLSKKEFQLILLITSKPGKVFRRNFILAKVWGDDIIVGDRNIDTHIKKLRKKIGKDHIQTVRGIGYKFIP